MLFPWSDYLEKAKRPSRLTEKGRTESLRTEPREGRAPTMPGVSFPHPLSPETESENSPQQPTFCVCVVLHTHLAQFVIYKFFPYPNVPRHEIISIWVRVVKKRLFCFDKSLRQKPGTFTTGSPPLRLLSTKRGSGRGGRGRRSPKKVREQLEVKGPLVEPRGHIKSPPAL